MMMKTKGMMMIIIKIQRAQARMTQIPGTTPKTPPPKSPPRDSQDKGKGTAEGTRQSTPHTTSPHKVMEAAMKTKD